MPTIKAKSMTPKEEISKLLNSGKARATETVDFSDNNRPKTCLEVDFPIIPINRIAAIEGNAGKPIYQISKWWARRRSSVFRAMLLAAAMKAPDDVGEAAKLVWDSYYGNHQTKKSFHNLKVADIFMGGGTTLVEGSRLGFDLIGTDLNPVAWFVVKTQLSTAHKDHIQALLDDVEKSVKPQIIPFYAIKCPRGHTGQWFDLTSEQRQPANFDPLKLSESQRKNYRYVGPEQIYVFWAKHGPCKMSGCGHRTPIMRSPVIATKTISSPSWLDIVCSHCDTTIDLEQKEARLAPDQLLIVAPTEKPHSFLKPDGNWDCPSCGKSNGKPVGKTNKRKPINLTLLIHPAWLKGAPGTDDEGQPYGGRADDSISQNRAWYAKRGETCRFIEYRGDLPNEITCPDTGETILTDKHGGTVPEDSAFACQSQTCGATQDQLGSIKQSGRSAPVAPYAISGYCPHCDSDGRLYNGRFFVPASSELDVINAAEAEWDNRKNGDLESYWPKSELPYGFMTTLQNGGIPNHGFTHWWKMFNSRQLLVLSQLLKAITTAGDHSWEARELVLAAYQQYLRNQNMFCIWNIAADKTEPLFANNNYHPKVNYVENCVFADLGRGNWRSCTDNLLDAMVWSKEPWELVAKSQIAESHPLVVKDVKSESIKVNCSDPVLDKAVSITCGSATDLKEIETGSIDLVITDPPFGGLLHYSELSDFFYVWLRLVLKNQYPSYFSAEFTPKALEVVANRARQPEDPNAFYQRLLTECWREAHRILKPGGILSFTFHHSEDGPWISVLRSLFDAGFYLEATYPIRSDETKGEGSKPGTFGSQKTEYDIVHVCRKRVEEPKRVSWARMRREVVEDIKHLASILEHHRDSGLLPGDLETIQRGKALEYFSKHYDQVYVALDSEPLKVEEALLGIDQILKEDTTQETDAPPLNAEPLTIRFLGMFDSTSELKRDQIQKKLFGTTINPKLFAERGWCVEKNKVYYLTSPLDRAKAWYGKNRSSLTNDYDQAMVLIGSCFDQSGINTADIVKNARFRPHPALEQLLNWYSRRGQTTEIRQAAIRAVRLLRSWKQENPEQVKQLSLFVEGGES